MPVSTLVCDTNESEAEELVKEETPDSYVTIPGAGHLPLMRSEVNGASRNFLIRRFNKWTGAAVIMGALLVIAIMSNLGAWFRASMSGDTSRGKQSASEALPKLGTSLELKDGISPYFYSTTIFNFTNYPTENSAYTTAIPSSCGAVQEDSDIVGSDLSRSVESSAEACCERCQGDSSCMAWVWGKERGQAFSNLCYLKGGVPENALVNSFADGRVSGRKVLPALPEGSGSASVLFPFPSLRGEAGADAGWIHNLMDAPNTVVGMLRGGVAKAGEGLGAPLRAPLGIPTAQAENSRDPRQPGPSSQSVSSAPAPAPTPPAGSGVPAPVGPVPAPAPAPAPVNPVSAVPVPVAPREPIGGSATQNSAGSTAIAIPASCNIQLLEAGYDYPGNDMQTLEQLHGPEDCCAKCQLEPRCVAWTFSGGFCFLKGTAPRLQLTKVRSSGSYSGRNAYASSSVVVLERSPGQSLFCWALTIPMSYEQALLSYEYDQGVSLFSCDEYSVFSNQEFQVAPALKTVMVNVDLHCRKGGEFGTALNTNIFMSVWEKVLNQARWRLHDWTVKVDPDAVFLPDRLRSLLAGHGEEGRGVYLNNCELGMHGPVEVFSRNAVQTWWSGRQTCIEHFNAECGGPCEWGEDMFIDQCLKKVLGVRRDFDGNVLLEDHCKPPPDWRSCTSATTAAFHPFKAVSEYQQCLVNTRFPVKR